MQDSVPVRLHVVQPLPPATTLQSFTLHILIEQNVMEAKAAAVVSMHIQERLEDKLWQSAFSLPRWVFHGGHHRCDGAQLSLRSSPLFCRLWTDAFSTFYS